MVIEILVVSKIVCPTVVTTVAIAEKYEFRRIIKNLEESSKGISWANLNAEERRLLVNIDLYLIKMKTAIFDIE
jgi:hypothetical protein